MDPGSRPRLSAVSAACGLRGTVSSCGFTGLRPAPPAPRVSYRPSPARGPPSLSGLRRWKDSDGGVGRVERGRLRRESTAGSGERPASIGRGWAGSARDPPPLWELLGGYLGCPGQSGGQPRGPRGRIGPQPAPGPHWRLSPRGKTGAGQDLAKTRGGRAAPPAASPLGGSWLGLRGALLAVSPLLPSRRHRQSHL